MKNKLLFSFLVLFYIALLSLIIGRVYHTVSAYDLVKLVALLGVLFASLTYLVIAQFKKRRGENE